MWETIKEVLLSANAWLILIFIAFMVFVVLQMSRSGLLSIKAKGLRLGSDEKELTVVRNQSQWSYLYIMSLKGKLIDEDSDEKIRLICENVLEKVYDKVIDWITYNHINSSNSYIQIKQSEIKCLVYSQNIEEQFKTPEFESRMNEWVKEAILKLIDIRKEYSHYQ